MINNLRVHNVKCFQSADFKFAPLTLFCGANSVGKSTAIQCLLLLKQSHLSGSLSQSFINLVGEFFSVGHIRDLFSSSPTDSTLSIFLDNLEFRTDVKSLDRESYTLPIERVTQPEHSLFSGNLIYLCAERIGPRNSYDVSFDISKINLGIYGQYAMSVLSRFGVLPAKNQQLGRLWMGQTGEAEALKSDITLEILVKSVMKSIFGDFDIKTETHNTMDRVSNTFSTDANQVPVRPVNTGFGISSTLPIIVGAFCLDEGDVLIVENPEVHLHPQAQSNLAKFLGLVALSGRQIIVETHSDHILNGFRVCAKSNSMASELIAINSITRAQDVRTVKFIQIDQDGNLTGVDKGFFDQIQKDLLSLF